MFLPLQKRFAFQKKGLACLKNIFNNLKNVFFMLEKIFA
jgi:hypothetical protein